MAIDSFHPYALVPFLSAAARVTAAGTLLKHSYTILYLVTCANLLWSCLISESVLSSFLSTENCPSPSSPF